MARWPNQTILERFWNLVLEVGEDDCWAWLGKRHPIKNKEYGNFKLPSGKSGGYYVIAHRFAWEITRKEEIPKGMHVDHTCNNPSCVNPKHLEVVTPSENRRRQEVNRLLRKQS